MLCLGGEFPAMAESSSSLAGEALNEKGGAAFGASLTGSSLPIAGENPPNKDFGTSLGSCFCSSNPPNIGIALGASRVFGVPKKLGVVEAGVKWFDGSGDGVGFRGVNRPEGSGEGEGRPNRDEPCDSVVFPNNEPACGSTGFPNMDEPPCDSAGFPNNGGA